ncbi:hypothetical protein [Aeromonas veronii]|uniref:hypothetical protein n=1 Tax=Aeromonas veronii TaxID=654 RepID=UPI003F7AE6B1
MLGNTLKNDTIELLKSDGTRHTGLRANVQKTQIFMDANGVVVESNDIIIHKMANGTEDTFRVIDPGFRTPSFSGFPPHYQMDVKKVGIHEEATNQIQNVTYNINGNNARVNQNSVDNSTNIVNVDSKAAEYIEELRKEISRSNLSDAEKQDAIEIIGEVDEAFQSGSPKKSVVSALLKSLPQAANVATIVSAIIGLF